MTEEAIRDIKNECNHHKTNSPKGLLFFDLETTGLDVTQDRIVEMCFILDNKIIINVLVNPGIPIPKEASDIHHLTDDAVAQAKPFPDYAKEIQQLVNDNILVGYNSKSYDSKLLHSELTRAGFPGIPENHPQIDIYLVWKELEHRKLADAVKRFCGWTLADSHRALTDIDATISVMDKMKFLFDKTDEELLDITSRSDDSKKWVTKSADGYLWNFGKHKGIKIKDTPYYAKWVLANQFPESVKVICRREVGMEG